MPSNIAENAIYIYVVIVPNFIQTFSFIIIHYKAQNIFTGLCKIENHSGKLEFYCKDHNELCCSFCITKIKKEGIGQHTDCNIYTIEDIFEEKKKNFENNIKSLEDLSGVLNSKELNEIIENIEKNREEIELDIEKTFMKYEMN